MYNFTQFHLDSFIRLIIVKEAGLCAIFYTVERKQQASWPA